MVFLAVYGGGLVWCSVARLDARNKEERSGIIVVVIVIAVAFDLFKGKP